MAEQYLTFTDETWPKFSENISGLNKKANSAIKGVKQDGEKLIPDENGIVNIESSNVDVTTVVTSVSQPTGLKDGDVWEEILNGEIISENESASSDNENIGVLGNYTGTIDTFPIPGTVGITYIDTDTSMIYLWDAKSEMYVPTGKVTVVFDSIVNFPETGELEVIYVNTDITNALSLYRWNGTKYVSIIASNITYDNTVTGLEATDVQTAIDMVFQSASDGKTAITTAITGLGVEVVEDPTFGILATTIETLNKGNFNKTITTINGSVTLPAGYYTGGTISLNLKGQTYTANLGSGSATTCAENGSATIPFGSISSQTSGLLTVSGGLIKAVQAIPASSLSFTITNKRANSGNGNGATATIKVYKNSTLISTSTVSMPTYGSTGSNTINVNVPAMSASDTIKVIATHATGYIDGTITFTITKATHTWVF